jgi:DNA transposition AAA+ family ATPase
MPEPKTTGTVEPFRLKVQDAPDTGADESVRIQTADVEACLRLAEATRTSKTRFARIIGEPGTGKTEICRAIAELDDAHRICCWDGIGPRDVLVLIAEALGLRANGSASLGDLIRQCNAVIGGHILVLDEANHLGWRHLEKLRYLADEGRGALILVGTTILEETFRDHRGSVYLRQLARRIGARQIQLEQYDPESKDGRADIAAYILQPRFGTVAAPVVRLFGRKSRGNWGLASELADGCQRVMRLHGHHELSEDIVRTAAADMGELA